MEEIQPQLRETLINGGAPHPPAPFPHPPAPFPPVAAAATTATSTENISSKRQRRPSVRLGEIGDQPAATVSLESSQRRAKQWKVATTKDFNKASKTRVLTNLAGGGGGGGVGQTLVDGDERDHHGELRLDNLGIGSSWRTKDSKSSNTINKRMKRPRTNWLPNIDVGGGVGVGDMDNGIRNDNPDGDDGIGEEGDGEGGFARVFEVEDSESPLKGNDSLDDDDDDDDDVERRGLGDEKEFQFGRPHNRARGSSRAAEGSRFQSDNHHRLGGNELDCPSETEKNVGNSGRGRGWRRDDGVRIWLNGLGLGRYWPVFEIHEVDEEVLPMLTLEDLKDMGINAVGSRRKMFSAIQKLGKVFS